MCGILGFTGRYSDKIPTFISRGLLESETRGRDATGFFARNEHGTIDDKRPIPAKKFIRRAKVEGRLRKFEPSGVIAHCRATTPGSGNAKFNRNNHPFIGKHVAIVHNGCIPGYKEVPSFANLDYKTETDSEAILRWIEKEVDSGKTIAQAIYTFSAVVPEKTAYAVACMSLKDGTLYLFRNNERPMQLLQLMDDSWLFASTDAIINASVKAAGIGWKQSFYLPDFTLRVIQPNNESFAEPLYRPAPKQNFVVTREKSGPEENIPPLDELKDKYPISEILDFNNLVLENQYPTKEEIKCVLKLLTYL